MLSPRPFKLLNEVHYFSSPCFLLRHWTACNCIIFCWPILSTRKHTLEHTLFCWVCLSFSHSFFQILLNAPVNYYSNWFWGIKQPNVCSGKVHQQADRVNKFSVCVLNDCSNWLSHQTTWYKEWNSLLQQSSNIFCIPFLFLC